MSVKFYKQYFKFNKILEVKENLQNQSLSSAKVSISSSWKGNDGVRHYSEWIASFKKESFLKVKDFAKGDLIICDGSMTKESYEKEGKRIFPDVSVTIFSAVKWEKPEERIIDELPPEDDIPF